MNNLFLKELKTQTDAMHMKAHKLEYFKVMFNHSLPKKCYIGQLRVLSIIYGALEREIEKSTLDFPKGYIKKLPLLLKDIYYLEKNKKENIDALKIALQLADDIMISALKNPNSLIGYLYTLEGSLQGGNIVAPHIIEQYKIKNKKGVEYFFCYGDSLKEYWDDFKSYLISNSKSNEKEIIDASNNCFESLIRIYETLYEDKKDKSSFHSAALNPEAGEHNVPTDPKEIEAAINACKKCWYFYPYFEIRYGERGYRFGISSVAWQVTLNDLSIENGKLEIDWLAKVLSNRGIPSIILETQLYILYKELNDKKKYKKILKLAEYLKEKRVSKLDQKKFEEISKKFESNLDPQWIRKFKNIGDITVSALIDKNLGFENSIDNIKEYFKDENIFSKEFIDEFQYSLKKVEKQLRNHLKQ